MAASRVTGIYIYIYIYKTSAEGQGQPKTASRSRDLPTRGALQQARTSLTPRAYAPTADPRHASRITRALAPLRRPPKPLAGLHAADPLARLAHAHYPECMLSSRASGSPLLNPPSRRHLARSPSTVAAS